jgi:hypothetical protein
MFLAGVGQAQAVPVLVPPGLSPGDSYHLVFVSSTRSTASLGGIAGADALVQSLADAAGIGVTQGITWQAILSDASTAAVSRFNPSAPIYDTQGNRIAVNGAALWNASAVPLENPIAFDENGDSHVFLEVWTGTSATGFLQRADSSWTSAVATDLATSGLALATNGMWANAIDTAEDVPQSLFAASSELTAPAGGVIPEPSSVVLTALGLLGIARRTRRRRA